MKHTNSLKYILAIGLALCSVMAVYTQADAEKAEPDACITQYTGPDTGLPKGIHFGGYEIHNIPTDFLKSGLVVGLSKGETLTTEVNGTGLAIVYQYSGSFRREYPDPDAFAYWDSVLLSDVPECVPPEKSEVGNKDEAEDLTPEKQSKSPTVCQLRAADVPEGATARYSVKNPPKDMLTSGFAISIPGDGMVVIGDNEILIETDSDDTSAQVSFAASGIEFDLDSLTPLCTRS